MINLSLISSNDHKDMHTTWPTNPIYKITYHGNWRNFHNDHGNGCG